MTGIFRRLALLAPLALTILVGFGPATPVAAWWHGGVFIGGYVPPVVVGPPVVYAPPPPVYGYPYYPPPAVAYPPSAPPPATASGTCYAGAYVCPLDRPPTPDGSCSCPTGYDGGRVYGHLG